MGTFVFRWPHPANDVHVTGTFDDWGKTEKLEKVGDVFEKEVTLPSAHEKYYYKFVVDDFWTTDHQAPQEDDGHYNVNNVLLPEQIKKKNTSMPESTSNGSSAAFGKPSGFNEYGTAGRAEGPTSGFNEHSVAAAGGFPAAGDAGGAMLAGVSPQSTTAGLAGSVPKESEKTAEEDGDKAGGDDFSGDHRTGTIPAALEHSTSPPGAFPETPANEAEEFSVSPIPASEGIGNPVSVPAGEKVPDSSAFNPNTVNSTATTSQEGYKRDASAAFPLVAAAAGVGLAGATGAGAYVHEKKSAADSFGVNPIPASSGIGNPISVPAGGKLPEQSSFNPNTVQSTATTSREDYEKDVSAPLLPPSAIAGATGTGAGATMNSAFSLPEKSKNMIPESSLPMGGEAKNTTDTGPFVSSAAPLSSTSQMASTIPLEPKRDAVVIEDEAPSTTLSSHAPTVPEMVKESLSEAHQSPEAAASPEVVGEKALMENELLEKVKSSDATGEPAPSPVTGGIHSGPVSSVASNVPAVVKESISEAHQPAEAAAAQEVVNEKREMERQLLQEVRSTDATGEPAPAAVVAGTSSGPVSSVASNVPAVVKESMAEAHQPAEAAAAQEVVNEKRDVESELLRTVKSTDALGEPAPTVAAITSETAPGATSETAPIAPNETARMATGETTPMRTSEAAPKQTSEGAASGPAVGASSLVSAAALVSPTARSEAPTHAAPYEAVTPGVETIHPAPHASTEAPAKRATRAEQRDPSPTSPDPDAPATPAKATTTSNTPNKSALGPTVTDATTTPSATTSPASTAMKEEKNTKRKSFFGKLKEKFKDL